MITDPDNPRRNGFLALCAKRGHSAAVYIVRANSAHRNGTATIRQTATATRTDRMVSQAMAHYGISKSDALDLLKS